MRRLAASVRAPSVADVFASASTILSRLSRWPRRVAALSCLLLAAGTALASPDRSATHRTAAGAAAGLRPGEVAVPVPVAPVGLDSLVRAGARVGVLAAPDPEAGIASPRASPGDAVLVADQLRVVSVDAANADLGGDAAATVVVAATRDAAIRLARYTSSPMLLIVDGVP